MLIDDMVGEDRKSHLYWTHFMSERLISFLRRGLDTPALSARLLLHLSLATWTLFGSLAVCATAEKAEPFVIGEKFQIESKVLGETRTYIIHTPPSYRSGKDAYPVLVLQDAEGHFAYTTSAVDMLSGNGRMPPMIVVGINNTDRTRDMTPTKPTTGFGGTPWTGSAGGADKFLSFIADELLPTVDRNYRTRPYRVLIGHSLGGLFAVYALLNRPEVFNGYLIISPSLWWDDQALVKAAPPFFAAHKDLRADLYMTMGSEGQDDAGRRVEIGGDVRREQAPQRALAIQALPGGGPRHHSLYEHLRRTPGDFRRLSNCGSNRIIRRGRAGGFRSALRRRVQASGVSC